MYDKYTARPAVFLSCNFIEFSPFYSALNIVFGAPAGYCVPVELMVAFLQCVKHSIRGPRGILCTRGAYGRLQKVGFFYFFEDTCVFGAFVLVFF